MVVHMGKPVDELTELVARAMIVKYNEALDLHVRPMSYEEVLKDPRYGTIEAARAAIKTVKDFYEERLMPQMRSGKP